MFAAALTSAILFTTLYKALQQVLSPYNITLTLGGTAIGVTWLAVACSCAASFFWLFSACCCPGTSNPHHYRSNQGGTVWTLADDPAGPQAYGGQQSYGRSRRWGRKNGAYVAIHKGRGLGIAGEDDIPLQNYPQPMAQSNPNAAYEPMRRRSL